MKGWKVVVVLLALWLGAVLYLTCSVPTNQEAASRTERSLAVAMRELDKMHRNNKELQSLLVDLQKSGILNQDLSNSDIQSLKKRLQKANIDLSNIADHTHALTYEEEHSRRKAENTVREMWLFLGSQLNEFEPADANQSSKLSKLKKDLEGYRRTMLDDFKKLRTANKAEDWRLKKSQELHELVQRRLHYIQNPTDCNKAQKIVCNLQKVCGFGCQLHHVTYCLIAAYAMKRTLILQSKGWRYSERGWESVFQPLSETCSDNINGTFTSWKSSRTVMEKYDVIELPVVDNLNTQPDFMPLAVPADLARELKVFHGDPAVWWIGQIVHYLFRLRPDVQKDVESAGQKMGFQNTIVGVHIRRTDKINMEADYHSLEEYMSHVAEFYDQMERTHPNIQRRVYLATDEPSILGEAKKKYPEYKFISDTSISYSAGLSSRYSVSSLRGVIIDLYYLARCDFLVCTFSSQVCRVAYEIMQTLHGDASMSFRSLDDIYYFGGQNKHNVEVLEADLGSKDGFLNLEPGDAVKIAGNHWNGFSKGINQRTGVLGLFPSYKTENSVVSVEMPAYPEVPLTYR